MKFKIILLFLCLLSLELQAEDLKCSTFMQKLPVYAVEADGFFMTKEYKKAQNKYMITADTALQIIEHCTQIRDFDFNLFNRYYSYAQEQLENIKNYK